MFKKLTLLVLSVAALVAFAVPTVAQATAIVTNENGEAAQTITAFSSNTKTKTPSGTLFCNEVYLHINLTQNNTEKATGSGSGAARHSGGIFCEVIEAGAKVVVVTLISIPHVQLNGNGHGTASLTYVYDAPSAKCHFEGNATVIYTPSSAKVSIAGTLTGKKIEGPGSCAATGTISGDFSFMDEFGGIPIIH